MRVSTGFLNFQILSLLGVMFFGGQSIAMSPDEEALSEKMRIAFCPTVAFDNQKLTHGFLHIGGVDKLTDQQLFDKGISLRKGEVKGLETPSIERLILQIICFRMIRDPQNNLNRRALHNEANTLVGLADLLEQLEDDKEHYKVRLPILYQEAWYLFSVAGLKPSEDNMKALVKDKKIRSVFGNAEVVKECGATSSLQAQMEEGFDEKTDELVHNLGAMENKIATSINKAFAEVFEEIGGIPQSQTLALLSTPEAQQRFKTVQEKAMQRLQGDIEGYKKNLLENTPFHLEAEKKEAESAPAPQPLSFDNETMGNLADLFAQLTYMVSTTKGLSQTDEIPVTVFLGRSTSWLALMQQNLQAQLPATFQFIHALVSGMSTEPYTLEQKESYKKYLDTLGFGTLNKDHPILLADVAETARTLHRFGELLKDTYKFSNIQYIAMMESGETVNLERARVIYLTNKLTNIMFAKHSEYARFCCFSQLYPSQWKEWEEYVHGFKPHRDALNLKAQLLEWMESDEGKKQLEPLLQAAFTFLNDSNYSKITLRTD